MMKKLLSLAASLVLTATATTTANGQTAAIAGEMVTVTAKVEAIESQSRTLSMKKPDGTYHTVVVPAVYERFDGIKVGDTVTVRYYDNIVFRKLNPGEKPVDSSTAGLTTPAGSRPERDRRRAAHDHHQDHGD